MLPNGVHDQYYSRETRPVGPSQVSDALPIDIYRRINVPSRLGADMTGEHLHELLHDDRQLLDVLYYQLTN